MGSGFTLDFDLCKFYNFFLLLFQIMGTIKIKKGFCVDCPPNSPERYLTAGRCQFHYKLHRNAVNKDKKHNVEKRKSKSENNIFFASQIIQIPNNCENCGKDIRYQKQINARALVAHILPKRKTGGFPSVATHPKNRVFLCFDECHPNFDNKGSEYAEKMPALPIMRERYNEFKECLTESERARVPKYLK